MLFKDQFLKKTPLNRAKSVAFFGIIIGSNNSFTLIKKQFQVFKIATYEFKYTMAYGQNAPSCDPLGLTILKTG